jgi:ATP-dependent helicase YprA (DUF1998 family)
MEKLDAVAVSELIRGSYLRYLRTLLPVRDGRLQTAIQDALSFGDELVRGPMLEATPPYAQGASLKELIHEGVLSRWMERIGHADGVPLDRALYRHQELAVRKAAAGRNVVVATGTGSGKTESFMLPILQRLAEEDEAGTIGEPGVRALLLYPMNALANDQLKRLRSLLAPVPEITFGRYTGETLQEPARAREQFAQRHPGVSPLRNELLSRQEIQATPPHLLITNYAMLEYLLLRPRDTSLFDGPTGEHWRFVVLDEAHVYDGAAGTEVAMLLRRLTDRVASGRTLQAIATSATVGGTDAGPQVAAFGETLLGAAFEYDPADVARQDVVWAEREERASAETWGPLPPRAYADLAEADDREAVLTAYRDGESDLDSSLGAEERISRAERLLAEGPRSVADVARELFGDDPDAVRWTGDVIALGASVRRRNGAPLIPARYHLWARATEGAFTCLSPSGPHVHLTRHEVCATCDHATFEVGSCKRCSATYLVGSLHRSAGNRFTPPDVGSRLTWLVLLDGDDTDEPRARVDEDEATLESLELDPEKYTARSLCVRCGTLEDSGAVCRCGGSTRRVLEVESHGGTLTSCGLCGGRSNAGQIRRLESGTDASVSVLSTALYQALPPDPDPGLAEKPGGGRKLLFFADSRQDAAYFAPYMEDSYADIVRRRVIYRAVADVSDTDDEPLLEDVVARARKVADEYGVFDWRASGLAKTRLMETWVQSEVISTAGVVSLEGMGLVSFDVKRPPGIELPPPLLETGLDKDEAWALIRELLRTVRVQGAVTFPEGVAPDDEIFEPRTGPIYVRLEGPEAKRKILSWLPGRGQNGRLDYLRRVMLAIGSESDPEVLARGLWRWITSLPGDRRLLTQVEKQTVGTVAVLDHNLVTARVVTADSWVFRCARCQRLAPVAVRDVCPTIACKGQLHAWAPPAVDDDDHHYRGLARTLNAVPLAISEHTAQLSKEAAASTQQRFLDGDLNALSCSTTFELGVDVGELQSVVLRNVPPMTSNYVQRAGRAGRRTDSAALVLTYAQKRSHDLTYFREPSRMIAGEVRPPRVSLRNHRIARRHVHAIALAAYFRHAADSRGVDYRTTADLFGDAAEDERLFTWLQHVPAPVTDAARRVVPDALHAIVGLADGSWANDLAGLLSLIGERHRRDVGTYRELAQEAAGGENYRLAEMYKKVTNTFERRPLLSDLAGHNVLPKYGFPIDTVEMRTAHIGTPEASRIELARDLRLAISDYAPGSQVVAGGFLWESGGVYRFPDREFPKHHYALCRCGWYRQANQPFELDACPACGASGKQLPRVRSYIEPEFGFVAVKRPPSRPRRRPARVYGNSVHLVDRQDESVLESINLGAGVTVDSRYIERGELVVINAGFNDQGYRICAWCGAGEPARPGQRGTSEHAHPMTGKPCRGPWEWTSLGHTFETDVLQLRFHGIFAPAGADVWWGLLYALVEASADLLQVARDDIDGTLHIGGAGAPTLVIFDDVPAGAGHVGRVRAELSRVVKAAYERVANCECGPETSCYRCLRGFRNQRMHDRLRRGAVADLLSAAVGVDAVTVRDADWQTVVTGDLATLDGRIVRFITPEGEPRRGTLWVDESSSPSAGYLLQSDDGTEYISLDDVTDLEVRNH